jgi:signal peptidase I
MLRLDSKQFRTLSDDLLRNGRRVRFQATGSSMFPTIHDGDFVTVEPVSVDAIRVGDVVLSSNQGRLLVHRVVRIAAGRFATHGDALALGDEDSEHDLLLGRVVSVEPMRIGFVVARGVARALGPAALPAIRGLLRAQRALLKLGRRSGSGRRAA